MSPESLAESVMTTMEFLQDEDHSQGAMLYPTSSSVEAASSVNDGISAAYVIPTLALGDETFAIFTYLGNFLSHITPHDLPVCKYYIIIIIFIS